MKPKAPMLVLLTLILLACTPGGNVQPGRTPISVETASAVDPGLNLLIVAVGKVQLKREGWADYHLTAFGTSLHRGDQLQLEKGAKAIVLCNNLTTWTVPPGAPSGLVNGCPSAPEPVLIRGKSRMGATRGGSDPLLPYIIRPRKTVLLNDRPTLRWNAVPGATNYTVRVKGNGVDWEIETDDTETVYPGNPPLQPGTTYILVVEADNGKSSQDEGVPGLGFRLLDENDVQGIQATVDQLVRLELPDEAEAFALAQLYAGHDLVAEAIEILDVLVESGSQAAAVYRKLGDFYWQVELNLLAEAHYLKAINLAETAGDMEGQAMAQALLAEVYVALGNKSEAVHWLTRAQAGYKRLGDAQRANEIAGRLADLQP